MYLTHYNLKEKPFQISTDPKFIWLGRSHKEALDVLEHGVLSNMEFLLVTGDVGTGKTTLGNALLKRLGNGTVAANITNPALEQMDFFNILADELNINKDFHTPETFLSCFSQFLKHCYLQKKKVLLIIDEAHRLDQQLLEQIQVLSAAGNRDQRVLNTLFIGQNEFNDTMTRTKNQALLQKMAVNVHLGPLKKTEIEEYILHRLGVAGHKGNLFNAGAVRKIFSFSGGYPRLINIICDHALLTGYVIGTKTIDEEIIKQCAPGLFPPMKKIDTSRKQPARATQKTDQKAWIQRSGNHLKAFAVTGLSLVVLGMVFYSGMDGGYFKQDSHRPEKLISTHVVQPDILDEKPNLSPERPQPIDTTTLSETHPISNAEDPSETDATPLAETHPMPNAEDPSETDATPLAETHPMPNAEDSSETDATPLAETHPAINAEDSSPQKDKNTTPLQESYTPRNSDSSDAPDQKDRLNRIDELRKVWEVPSIPPLKTVINFDHNSNDLSDEDFETLEPIGTFISQHPDAKIIIKGYTDTLGKYLYNKKISEFRANLAKSYFIGRGISPSRIQVFGMGSENPRRSNQTREGRMMNRRVEINITFH